MDEVVTRFWETDTRYYTAELMQDLFGEWAIFCRWGGKRNNRYGRKTINCISFEEALIKMDLLDKKRIQRKYRPVLYKD